MRTEDLGNTDFVASTPIFLSCPIPERRAESLPGESRLCPDPLSDRCGARSQARKEAVTAVCSRDTRHRKRQQCHQRAGCSLSGEEIAEVERRLPFPCLKSHYLQRTKASSDEGSRNKHPIPATLRGGWGGESRPQALPNSSHTNTCTTGVQTFAVPPTD